jgi:hypothetical protein
MKWVFILIVLGQSLVLLYPDNSNSQNLFGDQLLIADSAAAVSVYAADLDLDGDMDILTASYEESTILWYENDGDGHFTIPQVVTNLVDFARKVYADDLDGDGDMDVLSASCEKDNMFANWDLIAWYENTLYRGKYCASFGPQQIITITTGHAESVFCADLDDDNDMDVVYNSGNEIIWQKNDGHGHFGDQRVITSLIKFARDVWAADLDGDSDIDILSCSWLDDKIAWYENDGAGNFTFMPRIISTFGKNPISIFCADIDRDKDIDVIAASTDDRKIVWYANDGSGTFSDQHVITSVANYPHDIHTSDIDRDGDMDVLSAFARSDEIVWYENNGLGQFGEKMTISDYADFAVSVHAADIDKDGDIDVLSASAGYDDKVAWYENHWYNNNHKADFEKEKMITTSAEGASAVFTADLDGDGDLDIISASMTDRKIAWYENKLIPRDPNKWRGIVVLNEDRVITENDELIIEPGTVVRIESKGSEFPDMETVLRVEGCIKAIGTETKPIIFESVDSDTSRSQWYGILLAESSRNNEFRHCWIKNAHFGIQGNGNWISRQNDAITECIFRYCGTAIGLANRYHTHISNNAIYECNNGIYVNSSKATLSDNWITDISGNAVQATYSTLEIHKNCITDFDQYGISLSGTDVQIINNVILTRHGLNSGYPIFEYTDPDIPRWKIPDILIKNNIIMSIYKPPVFCRDNSLGRAYVLYNLCFGMVSKAGDNLFQSKYNLIDCDPLFENMEAESKYGFRLEESSPCINAGDPQIRDTDGSYSDMGIYGGTPIPPPVVSISRIDSTAEKALFKSRPDTFTGQSSVLNWANNDVGAFNLYWSTLTDSAFVRINPAIITDTQYYIGNQPFGYFMLRSVKDNHESYNSRSLYKQTRTDTVWKDAFDDKHLNRNQWIVTTADSTVHETERGLELKLPGSKPAELASVFTLSGDFDIQLDYSMLLPASSGSGFRLILENQNRQYSIGRVYYLDRTTLDGKSGHMYSCEFGPSEPDGYSFSASPNDSLGAFRIVRVGSGISFYFLKDSKWTLLESRSLTTKELRLRFRLFALNSTPAIQASLTSFIIYKGRFKPPNQTAACFGVPSDYPNIQQALDAATSGDTIKVAAGKYKLSSGIVNNSLNNLHLLGAWASGGTDTTLLDASANPGTFDALRFEGVSDCEISGFVIQRAKNGIVMHNCTHFEISNCYIRDCDETASFHGNGLVIGGGSQHGAVHHCIFDRNEFHAIEMHRAHHINIYNNTITRTLKYDGIIFGETCSYIDICSNIIAFGQQEGIEVTGEPQYYSLDYNCYWNNAKGSVTGAEPGRHALFTDPCFIDLPNNNFNLQRQSPCRGRGQYGRTIGAVSAFYTDVQNKAQRPLVFKMMPNYPNPFNAFTRISFQLPHHEHVRIDIFNILGQRVKSVLDKPCSAGEHVLLWDGRNQTGSAAASGVYICVIITADWVDMQKMLLLR